MTVNDAAEIVYGMPVERAVGMGWSTAGVFKARCEEDDNSECCGNCGVDVTHDFAWRIEVDGAMTLVCYDCKQKAGAM